MSSATIKRPRDFLIRKTKRDNFSQRGGIPSDSQGEEYTQNFKVPTDSGCTSHMIGDFEPFCVTAKSEKEEVACANGRV